MTDDSMREAIQGVVDRAVKEFCRQMIESGRIQVTFGPPADHTECLDSMELQMMGVKP